MPGQRKGGIILFDYTGCECKSCGKKFTSEDDIVVCPECGTPYHRECWKKEGKCINTELHESHQSWKEANTAQSDAPVCKKCGNRLREDQLFCDKCGVPTDFFFSQGTDRPAGEAEQNENEKNEARRKRLYFSCNHCRSYNRYCSFKRIFSQSNITR